MTRRPQPSRRTSSPAQTADQQFLISKINAEIFRGGPAESKLEASTPVTFERYTQHLESASFGTKFEGLEVSRSLPDQISGLYHAGSVGIIMSGWLGAMNYGVIVANEVDSKLM